jgi:hypothetical protein
LHRGGDISHVIRGNKCVKVEEKNEKYGKCEMNKEEVKRGKYKVKKLK